MNKRGVVTFVFDDGYEAVYRRVVPLLDKHNFPGVFALPLNAANIARETGAAMRPYQQWQAITNRHEIAAHSIHHSDLVKLTSQELIENLQRPQQILQATTLVYPGGSYSHQVMTAAGKYYQAARSVKRGFETLPPHNPLALKTFNFSQRNFSVAKANLLALWAYLAGKWLIETYHIIDTAPHAEIHSVQLNAFAKHVEFVARLPVAVKTIRQVITNS